MSDCAHIQRQTAMMAAWRAHRHVARTVAQFQPTIPAYAAAANGLKITVDELYLVCQYCLPVHGTVPRPLSSQFVYDNITLLQEPIDVTKPLAQAF